MKNKKMIKYALIIIGRYFGLAWQLLTFIFWVTSMVFFLLPIEEIAAEESHAHPTLLFSHKSIDINQDLQPSYKIGLYFTIDPGWHIYWRNGGEVGLPVEFSNIDSPQLLVEEMLWPSPQIYVDEANLVSYIYEKEVLIILPVSYIGDDNSKSIYFNTLVKWLECRQTCVPRQRELSVVVDVRNGSRNRSQNGSNEGSEIIRLETKGLSKNPHFEKLQLRFNNSYPFILSHIDQMNPILVKLSMPLLVAKYGWQYPVHFGEENTFSIDFIYTHDRFDGKWQSCVLLPYSQNRKKSNIMDNGIHDWDYGLRIGKKVSGSNTHLQFRLSLPMGFASYSPGEQSSLPWASFTCPEFDGQAIDFPLPVEINLTIEPVKENQMRWPVLEHDSAQTSLLLMVIFAFVGGLILNVMPCVLPVISIKVLSMVNQAGSDSAKVLRLGLAFVGGVLASFLFLALAVIALQSWGQSVGWGFQFQNIYFILSLIIILFVFALSLFNVFTINFSHTSSLDEQARKGGLVGSFFQGILATVMATPCSAPFLGSAMGFAFSQNPPTIILLFLAVGLGLSSPYLLLALRPNTLAYLPKPGNWMESFKQLMGFFLLATMLWLFWLMGQFVVIQGLVDTAILLFTLAFILWLVGKMAPIGSTRRRFYVVWCFGTIIFIIIMLWYIPQLDQHRQRISTQKNLNIDKGDQVSGINWQSYSQQRLQEARLQGLPVFLKFTADWCLTCKLNEKTVLVSKKVIEAFDQYQVVALSADWTQKDDQIGNLLRSFGRSGVPFYVLYPGLDQPIKLGELITPDMIVSHLSKIRE